MQADQTSSMYWSNIVTLIIIHTHTHSPNIGQMLPMDTTTPDLLGYIWYLQVE